MRGWHLAALAGGAIFVGLAFRRSDGVTPMQAQEPTDFFLTMTIPSAKSGAGSITDQFSGDLLSSIIAQEGGFGDALTAQFPGVHGLLIGSSTGIGDYLSSPAARQATAPGAYVLEQGDEGTAQLAQISAAVGTYTTTMPGGAMAFPANEPPPQSAQALPSSFIEPTPAGAVLAPIDPGSFV